MKTFVLLLMALTSGYAQDVAVKITGKGANSSTASTTILRKSALVTYAMGNATVDINGTAVLPVLINNKTGNWASGLQFELKWTATDVTGVSVTIGPAAVAANKTLTCAAQDAVTVKCVIVGQNQTGIADGVVALASFQTNIASQSETTVTLFGTVSASGGGSAIPTAVLPTGGTISMPAVLVGMSCSQPDIWPGTNVDCTLTLNKPAPAPNGTTILLESDSALVAVPIMKTIIVGALSGVFTITGN